MKISKVDKWRISRAPWYLKPWYLWKGLKNRNWVYKGKARLGDARECEHCNEGIQVLRDYVGYYNIWECTNEKCRRQNLILKEDCE